MRQGERPCIAIRKVVDVKSTSSSNTTAPRYISCSSIGQSIGACSDNCNSDRTIVGSRITVVSNTNIRCSGIGHGYGGSISIAVIAIGIYINNTIRIATIVAIINSYWYKPNGVIGSSNTCIEDRLWKTTTTVLCHRTSISGIKIFGTPEYPRKTSIGTRRVNIGIVGRSAIIDGIHQFRCFASSIIRQRVIVIGSQRYILTIAKTNSCDTATCASSSCAANSYRTSISSTSCNDSTVCSTASCCLISANIGSLIGVVGNHKDIYLPNLCAIDVHYLRTLWIKTTVNSLWKAATICSSSG